MADHTALDWRPLLPRISIPCLNVVGRKVCLLGGLFTDCWLVNVLRWHAGLLPLGWRLNTVQRAVVCSHESLHVSLLRPHA